MRTDILVPDKDDLLWDIEKEEGRHLFKYLGEEGLGSCRFRVKGTDAEIYEKTYSGNLNQRFEDSLDGAFNFLGIRNVKYKVNGVIR